MGWFYDLPEMMKKIEVYGDWKITNNLRKSKYNYMQIECICITCGQLKWKTKSEVLDERKCNNCRFILRKRNYYKDKKSRDKPIGKYREKCRQAAINKYENLASFNPSQNQMQVV